MAQGRIVTFYSYKGGTGRSMALANFAWALAASGAKVLTIDWDLEAPGLHRYFRPFLIDPDLTQTNGLIDVLWSLEGASSPPDTEDIEDAFERATQCLDVKRYLGDGRAGKLDLICAGRQGPTYSERVNTFDWRRFYELGGARVLDAAKNYFRENYDWVVIDSRTGVSDTSGICTMQFPDAVVACFTMNRQSIDGVSSVLRSIRSYRSSTIDGAAIAFYPLATRIENGEQRKLEVARLYARKAMDDFLPKSAVGDPRAYWDRMEIPYRQGYAFEEALAAFADASGLSRASDSMIGCFERMSRCITENENIRIPDVADEDRVAVLAGYALRDPFADKVAPMADGATEPDFVLALRKMFDKWMASGGDWPYLLNSDDLTLLRTLDPKSASFAGNTAMQDYIARSQRKEVFFKSLENSLALRLATTGALTLALLKLVSGTPRFYTIVIAIALSWIGVSGAALQFFSDKAVGMTKWSTLDAVLFGMGSRKQRISGYIDGTARELKETPRLSRYARWAVALFAVLVTGAVLSGFYSYILPPINRYVMSIVSPDKPTSAKTGKTSGPPGGFHASGGQFGTPAAPAHAGRLVYIQYRDDSALEAAKDIEDTLTADQFVAPGVQSVAKSRVDAGAFDQVKYFHDEDRPLAVYVAQIANAVIAKHCKNTPTLTVPLKPDFSRHPQQTTQLEIWLRSSCDQPAAPTAAPR